MGVKGLRVYGFVCERLTWNRCLKKTVAENFHQRLCWLNLDLDFLSSLFQNKRVTPIVIG